MGGGHGEKGEAKVSPIVSGLIGIFFLRFTLF